MHVVMESGARLPERAHNTDAGLDLRSRINASVDPYGTRAFDTGVRVQIPPGHCGIVTSKSGLLFNNDIACEIGIVDEGYTGSIRVKLANRGDKEYKVKKGDKIAQLLVIPCSYVPVEVVDDLQETERGTNGFGSSGR